MMVDDRKNRRTTGVHNELVWSNKFNFSKFGRFLSFLTRVTVIEYLYPQVQNRNGRR